MSSGNLSPDDIKKIIVALQFHAAKRKLKIMKLFQIRKNAMTQIQNQVRGFITRRKMKCLMSDSQWPVLFWKFAAESVFLVGDFTEPAWQVEIPMIHNDMCKLWYTNYLEENQIEPGKYRFKFVVDGEWLCDGNFPVAQEKDGTFNNIITIQASRSAMFRVSSYISGDIHQLGSKILPHIKEEKKHEEIAAIRTARSFGDLSAAGVVAFMSPKKPQPGVEYRLISTNYKLAKPHVGKMMSADGSCDIHFINEGRHAFGLADGAGEWSQYGVDPRFFPEELLHHCQNCIEGNVPVKHALKEAYERTNSFGSGTVLLTQYADGFLNYASLGDSAFLILRETKPGILFAVYRSKVSQHSFNCPYQLSNLPKEKDFGRLEREGKSSLVGLVKMANLSDQVLPSHAKNDAVPVTEGDIIIAGTNGLFDNLFDEEIITAAEEALHDAFDKDREFAAKLAELIVRKAINASLDSNVKSPFSFQANKLGMSYSGGKPDDTTVIVSLVTRTA